MEILEGLKFVFELGILLLWLKGRIISGELILFFFFLDFGVIICYIWGIILSFIFDI